MLMIIISELLILLVLVLAIWVGFSKKTKSKPPQWKILLIACTHLFLLGIVSYLGWPVSPWGRTQMLNTANEFMANLNTGEYMAAIEMLENSTEVQESQDFIEAFRNPENQPITWHLEEQDYFRVNGTAVFPDGEEQFISINLNWRWERAHWKIEWILFDQFVDRRFQLMGCNTGIPYEFLRDIIITITLIITALSANYLIRTLRGRQPFLKNMYQGLTKSPPVD